MTRFYAPISEQIWDMKYRLKDSNGTPIDETVEDTWRRIAKDLARAEPEASRDEHEAVFYSALEDFKYLPAGRITAGAGTSRTVTLFNCFVMGTIPDSMSGIFDMLKEAALTMQQGGGIGYDFSTIRPKTAWVKGVDSDASGPLSFMDCWDAMCRTVMSAGSRRGAMMATMRCDHPDVEDFISAKADASRLRMFNLSVLVTDDFMKAVKADADWELVHSEPPANRKSAKRKRKGEVVWVHGTVRARDLWNKIIRSTYDQAEPGVIFIDRINQDNNLRYCESIAATNPCGEQPLPPYGACLLGSVNLAQLIAHPFEGSAGLDAHRLSKIVRTAVRMMDNVVDVSKFPLPQQEEEAKNKRRIGLGVTGVADALMMVGLRYGTQEAADRVELWLKMIDEESYRASVDLAKEKGAFPLFDPDEYLAEGTHASRLPEDLQQEIRTYGIRNALLTSIAPTGTISLYAGNVSSGIEPVFAYSYQRKVLRKDGTHFTETVEDYAVALYRQYWEDHIRENVGEVFDTSKHLPDHFVTAQELKPRDHVIMQAAAQRHVDSSISKTINCPEDITFEDFEAVYMDAWESGCKGCTTYRPNDVTGSVLSVEPAKEKPEFTPEEIAQEQADHDAAVLALMAQENHAMLQAPEDVLPKRPEALSATVYKIKFGLNEATYLTVSDIEDGQGGVRPFEIFLRSTNPEHDEWMTALARMVSAIFRRPHPAGFVAEELRQIVSPATGGHWGPRGYQPSLVAAIGLKLKEHMDAGGVSRPVRVPDALTAPYGEGQPETTPTGKRCASCHGYNVKVESGCETCIDCGHSKCG